MYYPKLKSISFRAVSNTNNNNNSEMLLSEKDINAVDHFNFLVRPALEFKHHDQCQIAVLPADQEAREEQEEDRKDRKEKGDKFDMLVSTLKLKIPSSVVLEDQENAGRDDHVDGLKTPTSSDHKIPATLQCPPAPRKPKSLQLAKRKITGRRRRRLLLDLTSEIEALFPPAILTDLNGKIKKVRQGSGNIL